MPNCNFSSLEITRDVMFRAVHVLGPGIIRFYSTTFNAQRICSGAVVPWSHGATVQVGSYKL